MRSKLSARMIFNMKTLWLERREDMKTTTSPSLRQALFSSLQVYNLDTDPQNDGQEPTTPLLPYFPPIIPFPSPTQPTNLFQTTLPANLTTVSTRQTIPQTFCTHPTAATKFAAFNSPCAHSTPELLTIFLCAHICSTDTTRYGISLIAISIQLMLFPALIEHFAHARILEVGSMQAQEIARRK